jgi:hypothetical protein
LTQGRIRRFGCLFIDSLQKWTLGPLVALVLAGTAFGAAIENGPIVNT